MKTKTHKTFTVAYRRKRQGKTDYKKRLRLLLARKPRLVVRKSLSCITAQIIEYDRNGDKVVAAASTANLKKMGWEYNFRNTPSAYLLGLMISKKAQEKGIKEAILDIGLNKSVAGSRIYAVLKGAVDNGMQIPHSEDVLPDDKRLTGKHIEEYATKISKEDFDKKFSGYKSQNADPKKITMVFNDIKKKIIGA